jgi:hypothetical protein
VSADDLVKFIQERADDKAELSRIALQYVVPHFMGPEPIALRKHFERLSHEAEIIREIVADHGDQHECPGLPLACEYPYVGCRTLRLVAAIDADHPDYRAEEWKP